MSTYIERLRMTADFFEQHPELPPFVMCDACVFIQSKEEALKIARVPGAKKFYDDNHLHIEIPLADDFKVAFFIYREKVCTAKTVTKVTIPARPEQIVDKVLEWECHPLLKPDAIDDEAPPTSPIDDNIPF